MNEKICPHMNCAVAHTGGCNCDMAKYCFECKKALGQKVKEYINQNIPMPKYQSSEYYDNLALEIKFKEAMNPDSKLNQERMKKAQEDAIKSLLNKRRSV